MCVCCDSSRLLILILLCVNSNSPLLSKNECICSLRDDIATISLNWFGAAAVGAGSTVRIAGLGNAAVMPKKLKEGRNNSCNNTRFGGRRNDDRDATDDGDENMISSIGSSLSDIYARVYAKKRKPLRRTNGNSNNNNNNDLSLEEKREEKRMRKLVRSALSARSGKRFARLTNGSLDSFRLNLVRDVDVNISSSSHSLSSSFSYEFFRKPDMQSEAGLSASCAVWDRSLTGAAGVHLN